MTSKQAASRYRNRRRAVIRRALKQHKVDALFITNTPDVRYLSGCTEGASGLLFGSDWAVVFTGKMFAEVIPKHAPGVDVSIPKEGAYKGAVGELNKRRHRRTLGFQGTHMSWATHRAFSAAMGRRKLVSIGDTVTQVRSIKDEDELRLIRKCVRVSEQAFRELTGQGARYLNGKTEKDIAAELEYRMRMLGADRQGFPFNGIIVASGPNSASCHHSPTRRKIRFGEPLLFDWGAEIDGYRSDITRTVFLGEPKPLLREIYEIVERANRAGVAAIRPGAGTTTVARKGWGVVRDAGYGERICHGLGHGIGLDVHEAPGFGNGMKPRQGAVETRLRKNMVVTVEPGIYFEGKGGVRIEDDVLVTASGHKCLTRLPRSLKAAVL